MPLRVNALVPSERLGGNVFYVYGVDYKLNLLHAGKPFTANDPCMIIVFSRKGKEDAIARAERRLSERFPGVRRRYIRTRRAPAPTGTKG